MWDYDTSDCVDCSSDCAGEQWRQYSSGNGKRWRPLWDVASAMDQDGYELRPRVEAVLS